LKIILGTNQTGKSRNFGRRIYNW